LQELKGFQKKYLRGRAHKLQPVVYIGQKGVTGAVCDSLEDALDTHELVKVKFVENKEKETKQRLCGELEQRTDVSIRYQYRNRTVIVFPISIPIAIAIWI